MFDLDADRQSIEAIQGFGGETNVPAVAVRVFQGEPVTVEKLIIKVVIDVVGLRITPIALQRPGDGRKYTGFEPPANLAAQITDRVILLERDYFAVKRRRKPNCQAE